MKQEHIYMHTLGNWCHKRDLATTVLIWAFWRRWPATEKLSDLSESAKSHKTAERASYFLNTLDWDTPETYKRIQYVTFIANCRRHHRTTAVVIAHPTAFDSHGYECVSLKEAERRHFFVMDSCSQRNQSSLTAGSFFLMVSKRYGWTNIVITNMYERSQQLKKKWYMFKLNIRLFTRRTFQECHSVMHCSHLSIKTVMNTTWIQ